jgi:hypothetical protein
MARKRDRLTRRAAVQEQFSQLVRRDDFRTVGIPVVYQGVCYRSKTEGRWAVFFEALGITHDYERAVKIKRFQDDPYQDYEIHPDFWLPESRLWAEVKYDAFDGEEYGRAEELVSVTRRPCVLLIDIPKSKQYEIVVPDQESAAEPLKFSFSDDLGFTKSEVRMAVRAAKTETLVPIRERTPKPPAPELLEVTVDPTTGKKITLLAESGPPDYDPVTRFLQTGDRWWKKRGPLGTRTPYFRRY